MEPAEGHVKLGHGPAVSSKPTSGVLTASSTLATVAKTSLAKASRSKSTSAIITSDGYTGVLQGLLGNCHEDSVGYVYFTVISPDGSPALDSKGEKALHYVETEGHLSYPEILREALFNDPEESPSCPSGYCFSKPIPGTDLRIANVRNPRVFRADWHRGQCGYLDRIQKFSKMVVPLGYYGYLSEGAVPQLLVIDFVEQQMLKTYSMLEVGLIAGFTAGLFSLFIVFVPVATYGYFMLCDLCWEISNAVEKVSRWTVATASNGVAKIQEIFWSTRRKEYAQAHDDESSNDFEPVYVRDLTVPPPAYTSEAPVRIFVALDLEDARESSRQSYD